MAIIAAILCPVSVVVNVRTMLRVWRARRLLVANLPLAAESAFDVPAYYRIGPRRPHPTPTVAIGIAVVAAVGLPIVDRGHAASWIVAVLGTAIFAAYAAFGPSAIDPNAALLDADGITFPLAGVRVPWSSVGSARITERGQFRVTIVGRTAPTGTLWHRWTARGMARIRGGATITMRTTRPEVALAFANRAIAAGPRSTRTTITPPSASASYGIRRYRAEASLSDMSVERGSG